MAINVEYGPISTALRLAQKTGQNQAAQQNFQDFTQFADLTQQAQNELDRRNATQIQNALAGQHLQEQYAVSQDTLAAENARAAAQRQLAQSQMANMNAYRNAALGVRQEAVGNAADYRTQRLDQFQQGLEAKAQQEAEKQNAISQLPPSAQPVVQATGRMPYANAMPDQGKLQASLLKEQDEIQAALDKLKFNPQDINNMMKGTRESAVLPGFQAGTESRAALLQQRLQMAQTRMGAMQAAASPIQQGTQALNTGQVVQAATQQQQAAPQQGQPQTGSTPANAVPVQSQADYDQLPPGAFYVLNGVLHQKA